MSFWRYGDRMKVLLLNAPGPFCRAGSRWPHRRKARGVGIDYHPFPFGLAYAVSRLQRAGHDVKVLDCIALGMDDGDLLPVAEDFNPDVVFMETSAPSLTSDVATMKMLRRPAIAGGAHATAVPKQHLDAGFAAVVRGEYDPVIDQAVTLAPQPWLATPEQPNAEHAPLVWELDEFPWPAWDQMPMEKYNDPFCRGRSVTVLSTRGCPYRCSFCTIAPYVNGRSFRKRDPERVCDEIAELIKRYRPDEIYFDDDTITANPPHLLALCAAMKRRRFRLPFSCMGNANVDREVLEAMADAGCRAFKFGVETGDPDVMARIPKTCDLDDVKRTVRDCHKLGIQTHATFLIGLPGETREKAQRTIDFAIGLRTHTLQFAIATPYPGTAFYDEAVANGWLVNGNGAAFDPAGGAVVSYPGYSAEDIQEMHALAWQKWQWHMLRHRPQTLLHHFGNAWRREGVAGVARLGRYGVSRLKSAWKARA